MDRDSIVSLICKMIRKLLEKDDEHDDTSLAFQHRVISILAEAGYLFLNIKNEGT